VISMAPRSQRILAAFVCLWAGIVVISSIAALVSQGLEARRLAPLEKERTEALQKMARQDVKNVPPLAAELDGQTKASLQREAKYEELTVLLIVSAVLFLVCGKWLIWLKGPPLPKPIGTVPVCAKRQGATEDATVALPQHLRIDEGDDEQIEPSHVDTVVAEHGRQRDATLPILQAIQMHYGYVPDRALERVCELTEISPAQIVGVSTFYPQFRRTPMGKHLVKVCHGTACHVAGAGAVTDAIRRALGIPPEADTDPGRVFTVQEVACLGCCTLAPVIQIDGVTYGHLTPDKVPDVLDDFLASEQTPERQTSGAQMGPEGSLQGQIRIGMGSCCVAGGSGKVRQALEQAVAKDGVHVAIKRVGCVGMCHQTPLVETVSTDGVSVLYARVDPNIARSIVRRHFRPSSVAGRVRSGVSHTIETMLADRSREPIVRHAIDVRDPPVAAFLGKQRHVATEHCGQIDPIDLDDYLAHDGFKALRRCVIELSPDEVIDEIRRSGLQGRGGAGYETSLKWLQVRGARGDDKIVICNGDEGDPGAFMDRMLMESYPYRIIEGLAIAAYAVGAAEGYFYIRAEYPLAVERIRGALAQCERRGLVGEGLAGGLNLRLRIKEGAGAFVCGEETALLASLEGRRGMPRLRPPYPAERGLWGRPTLVNNVETYAVVPWIIRNGGDALQALGSGYGRGTKVFALAGKVARGGLIEVPMGITLRQIVEEIGGGVRGGKRFKAIQVGGPSGGCVPAELADTAVDYEALMQVGAIMGSGGLVVLDETDCMVDIARYFLQFTQNQSCGRCTFCRIGTRRMLEILDKLCAGQGRPGDLDNLEGLASAVKQGSLCGLGRTAPNPILTTMRYFRDEYEAHLEGRCPAGKCKALITYSVTEDCIGCTLCAQHCPAQAIGFAPYEKHEIDRTKCIRCGTCQARCPMDAIKVK